MLAVIKYPWCIRMQAWKSGETDGASRNCEKVYNIFSVFVENCLIDDCSLLWPGEHIWNLNNLEAIKKNFIDNPIWEGEYWEKIEQQFHDLSDSCWKALADAHLIYVLPSTFIKPEKKYELIKIVCDKSQIPLIDFDDPFWGFLHEGFTRTTMRYHLKYMQLWPSAQGKTQERKAFFVIHK